ncbi:hypothetical protein GDO78_002468 [Eleutherodactylus coqui]|uniref:Uncharacterized protein n=1 Tax=Eleutherodactylus coqui TaxID=57060 RepID=A0A8J6EWP4_ELECQ|nr:hypothetical protein GDO78_002468 [Eleutherodactylus coqui]
MFLGRENCVKVHKENLLCKLNHELPRSTSLCIAVYRRENEGLLGADVFPLHYHNAPKNPYCSCSVHLSPWTLCAMSGDSWDVFLESLFVLPHSLPCFIFGHT